MKEQQSPLVEGIYIPGYGIIRIEEDVYINEDGQPEILNTMPKDSLVSIPFTE